MLLWIIFACLTAAVAALLILPLARGAEPVADSSEGEAAVYRDQLRELERDKGLGLIGEEEAEYARAEIGRRLIASAGKDGSAAVSPAKRRASLAVMAVTVVVPAIGLCLYLALGSPWLPAQPLAARLENPGNNLDLLVAKAERHLALNPNDGSGWDLLAPIYFRTQRMGDAEMAYRNAIRLIGPSAERLSGLGETLVAVSDGIVTADAHSAFEAASKENPQDPRVRFYLALALEQAGKNDEARAAFQELAKDAPAGAPWAALVNEHITKTGGTVIPDLDNNDEAVAAIKSMGAQDQQDAIKGMVEALATRLEQEPNNLAGWLQLVRSYAVLGDRAKAAEALNNGLKAFPAAGNEGQQLVALGQEIGLSLVNSSAEGAKP